MASRLSLDGLRTNFRGPVLGPDDTGYEVHRHVWNRNINRRPAVIARCSGVADVIEAVKFARARNLLTSVRCGGHNAAGHGTCDDGIVIDLSLMKGIQVDPLNRTVRAQGGATWADFDRETQAFGLATTGGSVSNTGIAGLTLGGGIGWLSGKHGLACDNLRSLDVVTADGEFLRASDAQNVDLFWALRGGGGNFGIVTNLEYQLYPVGPNVLAGMVLHPIARAREALRFYRDFSRNLPDEASCWAALLNTPDGMPVVGMLMMYAGAIDDGQRVLQPAREFGPPIADLVQPMPYVAYQSLLDAGFAAHGLHRYWKSGYATDLSDGCLDELATCGENLASPLSAIIVILMHGAAARVSPEATAFGARKLQWDVDVVSQWSDPSDCSRQIAWTREMWRNLAPFMTDAAMINHIDAEDEPDRIRASYAGNYGRLAAIKDHYDPTNFFSLNANISPGSAHVVGAEK